VPEPRLTDVVIQPAIERNGAGRAALHARVGVGERLAPEIGRVVEREIRADDVDARQASVP
jgi:hypothetical protein